MAEKPSDAFSRYHHLGQMRPVVDAMLTDISTFLKLFAGSRFVTINESMVRVPARFISSR